jgi:anti-anti-sigma factor
MFDGPQHVVVAANRAARRTAGDRNVIGLPAREAVPDAFGRHIFGLLDDVYNGGTSIESAEDSFTVTVLPVTDGAGQVTGVIAYAADVTAAVHGVMIDLQHTVTATGLPVLPEMGMAAAYLPAGTQETAGGDWFDVVQMPGRRLGLVVGDVVGHGAKASAIMGQLRAITAERLLLGDDLTEVQAALDAFAASAPQARGTTICVAVVDRLTGALEYCTRGHPPPLIVASDGNARVLPRSTGPPLAFGSTEGKTLRDVLRPADTILLYTNGVVERPGRTVTAGIDDLADIAGRAVSVRGPRSDRRGIADEICTGVLRGLNDPDDDVSLLAVTAMLPAIQPFTLSVPATPDQLGVVRHRLTTWLMALGLAEPDLAALELSVVEAVTNSVEHAYIEADGRVLTEASLDESGRIQVVVTDTGRWKPMSDEPGFRGRGLLMMRESMDELRLSPSASGTTVAMARTVRGSVRDGGGLPRPVRDRRSRRLEIEVVRQPDAVCVSVSGVVDSSTVAQLRGALLDAARRGPVPITLILDKVTLLGSAGLRLLAEQGLRLREVGRKLRLVAPPGSPAGDVLDISGVGELLDVRARV